MTPNRLLGHSSGEITRATGLELGLQMKGSMKHCEGCGLGNNVNKEQVPRAKEVGHRMFMDINSIKYKSAEGLELPSLIYLLLTTVMQFYLSS